MGTLKHQRMCNNIGVLGWLRTMNRIGQGRETSASYDSGCDGQSQLNVVDNQSCMAYMDLFKPLTLCTGLDIRLLKQIVCNAPDVSTFIRKKLRASHIEYLPPKKPHGCVLFPIGINEMRPKLLFACIHL